MIKSFGGIQTVFVLRDRYGFIDGKSEALFAYK